MSTNQTRPIDFRSDTLTMPSEGMREAMAAAPIGDDVFGEDPTINELQRRAAEITGKQAALFVASGTMANLTSLLAQTRAGDELLVGRLAHIVRSEAGGISRLGGVLATILEQQPDGGVDPDAVAAAVRTDDIHQPHTTLLALENTHNFCGGAVLSLERMRDLANVAHQHGLRVHVDGARIFNAAVASGHAVKAALRRRGQHLVLPLEGPRRAGRLADLRRPAVHRRVPTRAQAGRRRLARGRHAGRGRALRARQQR